MDKVHHWEAHEILYKKNYSQFIEIFLRYSIFLQDQLGMKTFSLGGVIIFDI